MATWTFLWWMLHNFIWHIAVKIFKNRSTSAWAMIEIPVSVLLRMNVYNDLLLTFLCVYGILYLVCAVPKDVINFSTLRSFKISLNSVNISRFLTFSWSFLCSKQTTVNVSQLFCTATAIMCIQYMFYSLNFENVSCFTICHFDNRFYISIRPLVAFYIPYFCYRIDEIYRLYGSSAKRSLTTTSKSVLKQRVIFKFYTSNLYIWSNSIY